MNTLNQALAALTQQFCQDAESASRVELAVITFGTEVKLIQDFKPASQLVLPRLIAHGETHMAEALQLAFAHLEVCKARLSHTGQGYLTPLMLLMTDGRPHAYNSAQPLPSNMVPLAQRIAQAEREREMAFFPVGIAGKALDMHVLNKLSVREPVLLTGLKFSALLKWWKDILRAISASRTGGRVALPAVTWSDKISTAPVQGWSEVDVRVFAVDGDTPRATPKPALELPPISVPPLTKPSDRDLFSQFTDWLFR